MSTSEFCFPDSLDKIRRAFGYRQLMLSNLDLFPLGEALVFAKTEITAASFDTGANTVTLTFADPLVPYTFDASNPANDDTVKQWIAGVYTFDDARKCCRLGSLSVSNFVLVGGDNTVPTTQATFTIPPAKHPSYLNTSGFVGKHLLIMTGYGNFFPWERQFQWGNEYHDNGTASGTQAANVLMDNAKIWKEDALIGKYVWKAYKRYIITDNTTTTITFTASPSVTFTNGDHYAVVNDNTTTYYEQDRDERSPFHFFGTDFVTRGSAANAPTFTLPTFNVTTGEPDGAMSIVADSIEVVHYVGGMCVTGPIWPTISSDVWTDPFQIGNCESPNHNLTNMFYSSWNGVQRALVNLSTNFYPDIDWTGMRTITTFVAPALFYEQAGINMTQQANAETVYWVAKETDSGSWNGNILGSGTKAYADPAPVSGTDFTAPAAGRSYALVYSSGFTRKHPSEFKYLYARTAFVPEYEDDGMGGYTIHDPPTDAHPGYYHTRPASTNLATYSAKGICEEEGATIANGMRSRYRGDNERDPCLFIPFLDVSGTPTVDDELLYSTDVDTIDNQLKEYAAHFFEGLHLNWGHQDNEGTVYGGTAAAAGTFYATAHADQDWIGGILRTESGTATSGSTTTLSNSARVGSGLWQTNRNRWVGFTLEVEVSTGVWEKRLITAFDGTTITVGHAFSVSANGKPYRIYEPVTRLNRLKGRTLILTAPGGTEHVFTILANDTDTVFFTPAGGVTPAAGWSMRVVEMRPGVVMDRTSGAWQLPTDTTMTQAKSLAPDVLTKYGFYRCGDYITLTLFDQVWAGLAELNTTECAVNVVTGALELNNESDFPGTFFGTTFAAVIANAQAAVDAAWGDIANQFHVTDPPTKFASWAGEGVGDADNNGVYDGPGESTEADAGKFAQYQKYNATPLTNLPGTVNFYNYAETVPAAAYEVLVGSDSFGFFTPVFDANGDSVVQDAFSLFASETVASPTATVQLGNLNEPADAAANVLSSGTVSDVKKLVGWKGYKVTQVKALVTWTPPY